MTYAEEAFGIYLVNKTEIIKRVSILAKEYQIFVLLPLDIGTDDDDINTNEAILISDKGETIYNYQKQHLVPYIEKDYDINFKLSIFESFLLILIAELDDKTFIMLIILQLKTNRITVFISSLELASPISK